MSTYTRWYRDGSVTLTKGSSAVVGTNTYWLTAGLNPGDIFKVDGVDYEIVSITDNTHLTLAGNYTGTTGSDKAYAIVRNFTATTQARMAAQTAELLGDFSKYIDTDMQSIHGKSAYQIACEKGYVGTESEWVKSLEGASAYEVAVANGYNGTVEEWLEALKAAGELVALNTRTEILTYKNAGAHNALYRGKNLGNAFTEAQSAAIRAGTFDDIYPGDYWPITTTYTYYAATGDTTANKTKTYYADVNGTALATQPEEGADISEAGYYEAVTTTATVNWRVAGLDYYLGSSLKPRLTTHHIVVVPDVNLYAARVNLDNETTGAYAGSEMYTKNLERAKALVAAAFGADHVLMHREYLNNAAVNGRPVGGAWFNSTVELMTEQMVYGGKIFGIGTTGGNDLPQLYTVSCKQLPLFAHRPDMITTTESYWLRDVVSPRFFALVHIDGISRTAWVADAMGVRPAALIY